MESLCGLLPEQNDMTSLETVQLPASTEMRILQAHPATGTTGTPQNKQKAPQTCCEALLYHGSLQTALKLLSGSNYCLLFSSGI